MKIKVNAGLINWQEFALRMLEGEVFFDKQNKYWCDSYCFLFSSATGTILKFEPKKSPNEFLKSLSVEKEQTLPELLTIKPRLCRVWDDDKDNAETRVVTSYKPNQTYQYRIDEVYGSGYLHAELLTNKEIIQNFFNEEQ